jgi:hypothetical protein
MIYFEDFVASTANLPNPDPLQRAQNQLNQGDILFSATSAFQLILQTDGNFVLYCLDDTSLPGNLSLTGATYTDAIWASGTDGKGAVRCNMQTDGNLVLYDNSSKALWNSHTEGNPGAFLRCQSDGNLVILGSNGAILWNSNTYAGPRSGGTLGGKVHTSPPPPPPPPPPPSPQKVWSEPGQNGMTIIFGSGFPPNQMCTIRGDGGADWGFVPEGPWSGDITKGIPIQGPCSGNVNESYVIKVSCQGLAQPVSATIDCPP